MTIDLRARRQRRRPAVARMRRRQANPLGPTQSRRSLAIIKGKAVRPGSHPREIRGNHARPARPHAASPPSKRCKPPAGLERHRSRAAGRRFVADADGPQDAAARSAASSPTLPSRPTKPWPTARPCTPGCPGQARRTARRFKSATSIRTAWAWSPPTADQPPPQRDRHSPQHAAAGHRQAAVQDVQATAAIDPGADRRGREPLGRRLHARSAAARWPIFRPGLPAKSPVDVIFNYQGRRPPEGPRARAAQRAADGDRDRPRERPEQGAHGRLAAVYLRARGDGVSVTCPQPCTSRPQLSRVV